MNPLNLLRRSGSILAKRQAHMTWATKSVMRSASRAGLFLRRQLWIWPIIAVLLMSIIGLGVRHSIEVTMKENLSSELQTLLNVETAMLDNWYDAQASNANSLAADLQIRTHIYELLAHDDPLVEQHESVDPELIRRKLARELEPVLASHDYIGYFVTDKRQKIIAASSETLVGRADIAQFDKIVTPALDGTIRICPPFPSVTLMKTQSGNTSVGLPTMYVTTPIRDSNFQVVAALALQIRPEREFTRILQLGRLGESGETYAFDRTGRMVSNSRFDEDLILLGILPDQEDSKSILNILIHDPQGDITEGFRPTVRRAELPMTRMAEDATEGNSNVDVEGYRDYRGVPVVGAWTWLPDYGIGVATEIDVAEAYHPLSILRRTFWGLFILLGVSALAIFVFTLVVARLRREAQKAAIEAQQLGQYTLEEKVGAGAMGVVYRGFHAMLRRPTAIKMLDVDKVNDDSITRFEREVQITCKLTHPNTVAIYDYGRTPEGVFYYAMEYLDGIDLQQLVEEYGPQPENRVIHILLQMCGSLYEAHSLGLVHRDIKPANTMLNRRGSEPDVVKVLDFGLVKAMDEEKQSSLTTTNSMTGTPLYMSPEAIQSPSFVDARSDIYAVGAVGYFLLTGNPVFNAENIVKLMQSHVSETPQSPSERLGRSVSDELEGALLSCLEKLPAHRPQTARDLSKMLQKSPQASAWSLDAAEAWWGRFQRGAANSATGSSEDDAGQPGAEMGPMDATIVGERMLDDE